MQLAKRTRWKCGWRSESNLAGEQEGNRSVKTNHDRMFSSTRGGLKETAQVELWSRIQRPFFILFFFHTVRSCDAI